MAAWAPGCDRRGGVEVWSIVTVVILMSVGDLVGSRLKSQVLLQPEE